MKQLIIIVFLFFSFSSFAQQEAKRILAGSALSITQVGGGINYADVTLNFIDGSGRHVGTDILTGDFLYVNDGSQGYYLPILSVLIPGIINVKIRVDLTNLPLAGIIASSGAVVRATEKLRFFPYVSGIGSQENQIMSEDFTKSLDSLLNKRLPVRYTGTSGVAPLFIPAADDVYMAQNSVGEVYLWNGLAWVYYGIKLYQIGIANPAPAVGREGSPLLKTYDLNGSKFLSISNGNQWVPAGAFLDTLNVGTINLSNGAVTGTKINQMSATIGQALKWNGTIWAPANDIGGGGGGSGTITAINSDATAMQYLAVNTLGTDFAINTATGIHTFNLPISSATNTGKLSNSDWTIFNNKQGSITSGNGMISRTGTNTWVARTVTGTASNILVTDGDGITGNPVIDIGTNVVTLGGIQTLSSKTLRKYKVEYENITTNLSTVSGTYTLVYADIATAGASISLPLDANVGDGDVIEIYNLNNTPLDINRNGANQTINNGTIILDMPKDGHIVLHAKINGAVIKWTRHE